jgi:hypothetical protein
MPATSSQDARLSDAEIRSVVIRLARPDGDGGAVIERAAIMAEGAAASLIEEWVLSHGGEPEAPVIKASGPGLYRVRPDGPLAARRPPRRYVLPAHALT